MDHLKTPNYTQQGQLQVNGQYRDPVIHQFAKESFTHFLEDMEEQNLAFVDGKASGFTDYSLRA